MACYDSPSEAAAALKEETGMEITPQGAEAYDPHKKAGRHLSPKWVELFNVTRKHFLDNADTYVPIANKTVRLREMQKAYLAHKGRGNWNGAMAVLEQVAKECGEAFTNRRELTGKDGKALQIEHSDMTDDQIKEQLAKLIAIAGGDNGNASD